jgi:hypothetical protein
MGFVTHVVTTEQNRTDILLRLVQSTSSTIHYIHKCNSCMKINKQNKDITFYVYNSFMTTTKHAINQSINQSIKQSINQSIKQTNKHVAMEKCVFTIYFYN